MMRSQEVSGQSVFTLGTFQVSGMPCSKGSQSRLVCVKFLEPALAFKDFQENDIFEWEDKKLATLLLKNLVYNELKSVYRLSG